jgi:hypothetical protein
VIDGKAIFAQIMKKQNINTKPKHETSKEWSMKQYSNNKFQFNFYYVCGKKSHFMWNY